MGTPTLVYDDDCGFCTWSAKQIASRGDVELVGFSELEDATLDRLPDDYEECAHLLTEDAVYSCGESIEEAVLHVEELSELRPAVEFVRQFDEYDTLRERAYRTVADNRDLFGKVLSADPPERSSDSE